MTEIDAKAGAANDAVRLRQARQGFDQPIMFKGK